MEHNHMIVVVCCSSRSHPTLPSAVGRAYLDFLSSELGLFKAPFHIYNKKSWITCALRSFQTLGYYVWIYLFYLFLFCCCYYYYVRCYIILDVEETAVTKTNQAYNKILAEIKIYPRWYKLNGYKKKLLKYVVECLGNKQEKLRHLTTSNSEKPLPHLMLNGWGVYNITKISETETWKKSCLEEATVTRDTNAAKRQGNWGKKSPSLSPPTH